MIRIGWWLLYLFWILFIGALILGMRGDADGGLRAPEELLEGVDIGAESDWMGVYINGRKVGYIHTELQPTANGYEIREFSSMSGSMMGTGQQMRMRMNVFTDTTLALRSFKGRVEADLYSTQYSGRIEENVLAIEITNSGKASEKFLPAPEPIYLSQAIKPLLLAGRLHQGDSLKLSGFDPISLEMQDLVVIGAPLEEHHLWGEDVVARKLTTRMSGMESTVFMDNEGNSLAEFGPLGLMMRREEMEVALNQRDDPTAPVDFLAIYAVKPVGTMRAPRKSISSRYKIDGIDLNRVAAASDRQIIEDRAGGIVEVIADPPLRGGEPADLPKFTQDAPFIESREKRIRETAYQAVQGATSRLDTLRKLTNWVFREVRKKPAAGIPSAIAVLESLEGDCNEHSVLFTALARSMGIPTRIQLGVVYQGGKFYYHAWPAAWIGGGWAEFDPTFGQEIADAARIALASGDMSDVLTLANVIGNLEIEIIESK